MSVKIIANKNTGVAVNKYANSQKNFGFVNVQSENVSFNGNRINMETRSCLLRGNVDDLQSVVNSAKDGKLPGRIRLYEITEDIAREVAMGLIKSEAHSIAKNELHSELIKSDFESAIEGYVKKNPSSDTVLTKDGERILRFQVYDQSGESTDILIQHDRDNVPVSSVEQSIEQE